MRYPFELLPGAHRKWVFLPLLGLTLLVMGALQRIGRPLQTEAAPQGILSFELAGNVPAAQRILNSWNSSAREHAALSLGLDYLFLCLYSTAIGCACIWTGDILDRRRWPLAAAGRWLAWALWLAGAADATENYALLHLLLQEVDPPWPEIARACALFKFALVGAGLLYAGLGVAARFFPAPAARLTEPK